MINSQNLINKICDKINQGGLSDLQTCQTTNALALLCQPVFSVPTFADLPDLTTYTGRMVYVEGEQKYYYADPIFEEWSDNFTSGEQSKNVIWAWGFNTYGRLGDDTLTSRLSPVTIVGGFTDWHQVSGGNLHSLAVRQNGTAWAWGRNAQGQLGDDTIVSKRSPVSVVGGFTDWCQVSAGSQHSLAVRQNGTAWSWGCNVQGQLGDDTITSRRSPVSVVGGFTNWCQVSGGGAHSAAVRQNGEAWTWGCNNFGQLGDDSIVSKSSPVSVVGGFTDWCQISGGDFHSLAVRQNGTAWAWGSNSSGGLGDDSVTNKSSPVSVVGGFTDWCQVSVGNRNSLAVRQNGTAWAWGCNSFGQLGDDSIVSKSSPVSVVGGFTDWCQVSAGSQHSLAVRQNGTAWAWGLNTYGRLGDDTLTSRRSPVSVVGGFTEWCQVSAGDRHSLGLRNSVKGI